MVRDVDFIEFLMRPEWEKSCSGKWGDRAFAEIAVADYFAQERRDNPFGFTFRFAGRRYRVVTQRCVDKPKSSYLATVHSKRIDSLKALEADYLVFTRVLKDLSRGWILGQIAAPLLQRAGTLVEKGKRHPELPDMRFENSHALCIAIEDLNPVFRTRFERYDFSAIRVK